MLEEKFAWISSTLYSFGTVESLIFISKKLVANLNC